MPSVSFCQADYNKVPHPYLPAIQKFESYEAHIVRFNQNRKFGMGEWYYIDKSSPSFGLIYTGAFTTEVCPGVDEFTYVKIFPYATDKHEFDAGVKILEQYPEYLN